MIFITVNNVISFIYFFIPRTSDVRHLWSCSVEMKLIIIILSFRRNIFFHPRAGCGGWRLWCCWNQEGSRETEEFQASSDRRYSWPVHNIRRSATKNVVFPNAPEVEVHIQSWPEAEWHGRGRAQEAASASAALTEEDLHHGLLPRLRGCPAPSPGQDSYRRVQKTFQRGYCQPEQQLCAPRVARVLLQDAAAEEEEFPGGQRGLRRRGGWQLPAAEQERDRQTSRGGLQRAGGHPPAPETAPGDQAECAQCAQRASWRPASLQQSEQSRQAPKSDGGDGAECHGAECHESWCHESSSRSARRQASALLPTLLRPVCPVQAHPGTGRHQLCPGENSLKRMVKILCCSYVNMLNKCLDNIFP